jgi:signal transduction histidine kinase
MSNKHERVAIENDAFKRRIVDLESDARRHKATLQSISDAAITEHNRAEEDLHASREQLRALAARLLVVREEERSHIAREIHDLLAQDLTRLKIDMVWLQGQLIRAGTVAVPSALNARITEMGQIADAAIHCVQKIATELRPAVLDSLGLCATVEWQARDFQDHTGIECHASVPEGDLPVGRDCATAAFRVLQESLTNVQRHAKATRVDILLREDAGRLLLRVHDDGCGIESAALKSPMSIGLTGMRERALLLGGQLDIQGSPGTGTTVEVRLPLSNTETPSEAGS